MTCLLADPDPGYALTTKLIYRYPARPCTHCGAPRFPGVGRGRQICDECVPKDAIKPCSRCGGPKSPGKGRWLCDSCEPLRPSGRPARTCRDCSDALPQGVRGKIYCDECAELHRETSRRRSNRRKTMKTRKVCRGGCGRYPGRQSDGSISPYCASCRRERFSPKRRKCLHCDERVSGPHDKVCAIHKATVRARAPKAKPLPNRLPGAPLAVHLKRYVAYELERGERSMSEVYAELGVHPRRLYAWAHEGAEVNFNTADRLAGVMGLRLDEVWSELA